MPAQVNNNIPHVYQHAPSTPRVQVQNDQRAQEGQRVQNQQNPPPQPRIQVQNDQRAQENQQVQNQQQKNVEQQKVQDNRQAQNQQRITTNYKGNVIDLTA